MHEKFPMNKIWRTWVSELFRDRTQQRVYREQSSRKPDSGAVATRRQPALKIQNLSTEKPSTSDLQAKELPLIFSQAQRVKVSGADGSAAKSQQSRNSYFNPPKQRSLGNLVGRGNELVNNLASIECEKNAKFLLFLKRALDSTLCGAKFNVFEELISA